MAGGALEVDAKGNPVGDSHGAEEISASLQADNTGTAEGSQPPSSLTEVLDRMAGWIDKHSVHLSEHESRTLALWAVHTWAVMGFYVTPRLIVSSATKGSGKTRQLELLENLVRSPQPTTDITPAALFRSIDRGVELGVPPTVLFDEIDATFNEFGGGKQEELRGIANSGYKQGGQVQRCVGNDNELKSFKTFAPVAFAGIAGNMPDTITSRAITIEMRKRKPGEQVAPFKGKRARRETAPLRAWLDTWTHDSNGGVDEGLITYLEEVEVPLPAGVEDRDAEIWEPLVAIADLACVRWGEWARDACVYFLARPSMEEKPRNVRLLEDIREVMGERESMPTSDLCLALNNLEGAEWRLSRAGGVEPWDLARMLKPFGVAPVKLRVEDGRTPRGYATYPTAQRGEEQAGLLDAWERHLTPSPDTRNSRNTRNSAGQSVADRAEGGTDAEQVGTSDMFRGSGPTVEGGTVSEPLTSDVPPVPGVPAPGRKGSKRSATVAPLHRSDESEQVRQMVLDAWKVGDAISIPTLSEQSHVDPSLTLIIAKGLVEEGAATNTGPLFKRVK